MSDTSDRDFTTTLGDVTVTVRRLLRTADFWGVITGSWLLVAVMIGVSGYPRWRVLVIAAVTIVVGGFLLALPKVAEKRKAYDLFIPWAIGLTVAKVLVFVAITGGLHGPLAIALPLQLSASLIVSRPPSGSPRLVAALMVALALIAVLPNVWHGPTLPDPWFTMVACVVMASAFVMHFRVTAAVGHTAKAAFEAAFRAREDLAEHALARAGELERIGSRLSHEIKNPLAAMKTLVQLCRRSTSDATMSKHLTVVESEIERMMAILQSHLTFSRPVTRLRPRDASMGQLADAVLDVLRARATASNVRLERSGDGRASVDPARLQEALINLVANAIEASPAGAQVRVVISDTPDGVQLAVRDTGRGMEQDVLARVGTPFFTTREQGTGLGFVLARAAFEQHGGNLEISSAPGRGTVVLGTLPRAPRA